MRAATFVVAVFAGLACAVPSLAQEKAATDSLYVDFAVPDLPALAALGLNPSKVTRPGTLKELSVAVFPLAGSDTSIGPGVAVSWAPVFTFAKDVDGYRTSMLRRLALSLVTSKEGTTSAVNAGAGLRVMLLDRTDVVLSSKPGATCADPDRAQDYECQVFKILESEDGPTRQNQAFAQHALPVLARVGQLAATSQVPAALLAAELLADEWDLRKGPTPFTVRGLRAAFDKRLIAVAKNHDLPVPALPAALSDDIDTLARDYFDRAVVVASTIGPRLAKLRKSIEQERWNWAVASVDVGIVGQSPSGSWADLASKKYGGLVSVAFPVGRNSQVVAQLEGRRGNGHASEGSHVGGGGRWLVGSSTKRFSAEAYVARARDADATKNGRSYRYTVGSEVRVTKGFWLEVAFGTAHTPAAKGSQALSFANLKYAFKSSPRFPLPGSVEE